ncbi:MAG: nitroreductase family protein, partial [Planctomycetes bacterium]|nr:nitroreductase family protein [Planctomycetota bacterium]
MDSSAFAARYHERTKHHPQRFARSLGYMDWANQPNPFRRFAGAPLVRLALGAGRTTASYDGLFDPESVETQPVTLETISDFLEHALVLSAWKEFQGSRWALRVNPSSGNLHPTEGYILTGAALGPFATPGLYHYAPEEHALERRCDLSTATWDNLTAEFPQGTLLVALTSIHWREAWKYGERAYRYCQHDVGHAIAAVSLAASLDGWRTVWLHGMADRDVSRILGLDRTGDFENAEQEHPDLLLAILTDQNVELTATPIRLPDEAITTVTESTWSGKANVLSRDHMEWALIDDMAAACEKPADHEDRSGAVRSDFDEPLPADRPARTARTIITQRRSAVAMDGKTGLSAQAFFLMLDRTLPRIDRCPWWSLASSAHVHLCLFVHLVDGLVPGLYFLVRSIDKLSELQSATDDRFAWTRPDTCPGGLPLFLLNEGDYRVAAGRLSCGQDIAADGAFSLGMIAEFEAPLGRHGGWYYRRLFWEAGMIG